MIIQEWRNIVGRDIKPKYERYVELINKKARLNGYQDAGDKWRSRSEKNKKINNGILTHRRFHATIQRFLCLSYRYEVNHFEDKMLKIYEDVKPLYMQLHAYVRRKLFQKYGKVCFNFEDCLDTIVKLNTSMTLFVKEQNN